MESGLNNSILYRSNIITEGQCLFIQRWREIFNSKTMDTYKCRLTNSHGILNEYLDIIKKVNDNIIRESNIEPVKIECIKKLHKDIVFKNNDKQLYNLVCSRIGKPKGTRINLISDIEVVKKRLDEQYLGWIIKELKLSINNNDLDSIEKHTENLATELIYKGWSKSSLYRLVKIIFVGCNDEFDVKWLKFISSISGEKEQFECYIRVKTNNDEYASKIALKGKDILKDLSVQNNGKIKENSLYFKFKGSAYSEDLNSFTEQVAEELADIESEYIYFGETIKFEKENAIIVLPTNKLTTYNISVFNAKEYYKNNNVANKQGHKISEYKEIQEKITNEELRKRLKNIIVQYRLGYNSESVETWFSSFWFALESLVATEQYEYIIDQIINIVTPIVTIRYPKQIIKNLLKDFERCGVLLDGFGIEGHKSSDIIKMVDILKDSKEIERLNECAQDYSLLSIRIHNISKWLKNSLTLKKFLEDHYTNIEWHLRRLFRIRNSFVHSANVEYDLYPITMHLHSYLKDVISEILNALRKGCNQDVAQIYSCSNIKYLIVVEKLQDSGKKDYNSDLICFDDCCSII